MHAKLPSFKAVLTTFLTITTASQMSADTITSITISNGVSNTTSVANGGGNVAPTVTGYTENAFLQSFSTGTTTYDTFIAPTSITGEVTTAIIFGQSTSLPASVDASMSDLDLSSGTLNTGAATKFNFTAGTIDNTTTFFLFTNGGTGGPIFLVDSLGADITTTFTGSNFNDTQVSRFNFERTDSANQLNNRSIEGITFSALDFTFASGKSVTDVVGFRLNSGSSDLQDGGIAVSVPEPTSFALLLGFFACSIVLKRRR